MDAQDTGPGQAPGPFADGMFHEEWFGLTSQGNGYDSPYMRQPRKSVQVVAKYWHN